MHVADITWKTECAHWLYKLRRCRTRETAAATKLVRASFGDGATPIVLPIHRSSLAVGGRLRNLLSVGKRKAVGCGILRQAIGRECHLRCHVLLGARGEVVHRRFGILAGIMRIVLAAAILCVLRLRRFVATMLRRRTCNLRW